MNWPLGNGPSFKGVYDRAGHQVHLFERSAHGAKRAHVQVADVNDPQIAALVDEQSYRDFRDALELLEGAGASFDREAMLHGDVTPVFFGSAVTNFGVQNFLDEFVRMCPPPQARRSGTHVVEPVSGQFSGFVFKIQANMDPRHRDRVAFVRVCSGKFERDMTVRNSRTGKDVRLSRAMRLFAGDRESLDAAYAGDVVGLANPGVFAIGDSLYEPAAGEAPVRFERIPSFAPEHFAAVRSIDTSSYKSFGKGIAQLREEGAIQVLYPFGSMRTEPVLAAVGALQFEVVKYRLESEYNVKTVFSALPYGVALRVRGERADIEGAQLPTNAKLVEDWDGSPVVLFESDWSVRLAEEWNPKLRFVQFTEIHEEQHEEAFGVRARGA
jgi:peptide chain release factor 3